MEAPREEEESAGPGREAPSLDPGPAPPASLAAATAAARTLVWAPETWPPLLASCWEQFTSLVTWLPSQMVSAFSPSAQTHAMQENEPQNKENQQPNEQFDVLKVFTVQVHVTGRTGGCEKDFLKAVTDHLLFCLKTEDYQEDSNHFLLVFCPVVSRVGTDVQNALEGLQGERKAVLILLHHRPKEYGHFLDTKLQAKHRAVVRTVHARYTLDSGLYDCQVNEEAVAAVAEVLKDLGHDCKEEKKDPSPTTEPVALTE